ncbi:MAG TPA: ABC transporter transmembrane domain-containing protein, partial [Gemmobacter sp.]|nr:ABC transporter transmembrane domain-containing protein [Gemmobacter sp.]
MLASLLWVGQAAVVAQALDALLRAAPLQPILSVTLFALLGAARAGLTYRAETLAQTAADAVIEQARAAIVQAEAGRSDDNPFGGAGAIAALAGDKLDLLGPFLTRYGLARARVMVVPLVILGLSFWLSWAVGMIFLVAGPLIPVFMALIGLAAKEASARQMAEIGTLNDFLVERLSALVDIRLLGAGDRVLTGFATQAGDLRARTMAVLRVAFLSSTVLELFAAIGVAMVAVYVGFSL